MASKHKTTHQRRPVGELTEKIVAIIGGTVDSGIVDHALTHRSYAYENGGLPNNERLEFLGDSVLGLVVTESLYADHPDLAEGQLAKLRAAVVNMRALAKVARELGVGDYLLLGRGEESTGGRNKASILADTMEALIGTVYLERGLEGARVFVHHILDPLLEKSAQLGAALDWKTSLQELSSVMSIGTPEYRVSEEGPDHEKVFTASVVVGEEVLGTGVGRSKKQAEQQAAEFAWTMLKERQEKAEAVVSATEAEVAEAMVDSVEQVNKKG
ncbi:ribonuclease III [Dermatophilus congolensis]|uniref:ribonuclease III n=1 Tax=Dermatophilus congolensis TaxID=1863 RepID=UPI001AAF6D36|nr:ribonuclease III [Dermatophilus congolensis]MBO3142237.1 ribonuclease III [Dermatophilus congolensis]MBO3151228.1 ribonuclease III [Dermatophilus congolensis]MBO3161770.1 ribonuclease III [Dermatophilus congolensis]MBO3162514.1 ribonuclease III [Dermatophilus congolensis]MBO3176067.1 ribonuclease III [Dermatophilus congolensis]